MKNVLRKVHQTLREHGQVLIIQPAIEDPIVKVEIDGEIVFSEVTDEKNFRRYLHSTKRAIHQTVIEGLFEIEQDTITPKGDSYHCNEYGTRKEWEEDRHQFCEDLEALLAISEKIEEIVQGRAHRVLEYWKVNQVLLRKKV